MSGFEKLNNVLTKALRAYEESPDTLEASAGITVALRFEGDLAAIEALGFETHMVTGDEALGVVWFKDIPALVAHPGVIRMAAGRPKKADLNTAAKDIRARATAPVTGAPVDGLWHAVLAGGTLTSVPNGTGRDVIVAVIDTGIDYKHPMFMSQLTPTKKTRILRIWDQGLTPASIAKCPPAAVLTSSASGETYGVEIKNDPSPNDTIDQALLPGAPALLHKDCIGHGTHVAGIAAGGPLLPPGNDSRYVGVAPEASIIAVKFLDNPDEIFYRLPTGGVGADLDETVRFRDAVLYCLRTARELGKPVVINMSFGDDAMPGDGLDPDAHFVDALMDPAHAAGPDNFPKGAVLVSSAGNDGEARSRRKIARIVVPSTGEIIVPLTLVDVRGKGQTKWKQCEQRLHKPEVGVHFWYRRPPAPLAVRFAMRLPNGAAFGADVSVGGELEIGFRAIAGPNDIGAPAASTVHRAGINHEDPGSAPHPAGGSVHRHYANFFVKPKESGGTISYHAGVYRIRIKAPPTTVIYASCDWEFFAKSGAVIFRVANISDGVPTLDPATIKVTSESSAIDTLGQNVITVAAYDETNSNHIAEFSSLGPLRDFSDPTGSLTPIPKPDIAAPGVGISSAEGLHTERLLPRMWRWLDGIRFTPHDGTSMSAPMIAGVIALMLAKKPDLDITQVRKILTDAKRAAVNPSVAPASTHAYGSGMVDALESHKTTL